MWLILAPIYGPLLLLYMAYSCPHIWPITALVQIRYKAWRFLTAFLIVLIFVPLNGGYMRAYMAIYGGSNGACMRPYMAIYGSSPIGRVGRKGIIGNLFPSLIIPTPSLPLPSLLEGKGAGVIPFPSFPYFVA